MRDTRTLVQPGEMQPGRDLLQKGRELARWHPVVPGYYLTHRGVDSEAQAKRQAIAGSRITQHAQIGYRDFNRSCRAWREIYETCHDAGVCVDRYGICLDWIMGLPASHRSKVAAGTGLILQSAEQFAELAANAPVAPHFGDFVMGFPAAIENTAAALAAGATSIGNLGQYFTFRLPGWDDDAASTEATVTALAMCAAQSRDVLIHSNLDDGFAAVFTDLSSCLGMALIEQYIVEDLIGGNLSHCWGHHFSDPVSRLAFHFALTGASRNPGTMVYGNTVSYTGGNGANHASLASYLLVDILGQVLAPSGHAINPVPVRENERIPDIDEIIEAQLFAARLTEHAQGYRTLIDPEPARAVAARITEGGERFKANVLAGLERAGIDTTDPAELLLALRRIGGKGLEERFGAGAPDGSAPRHRRPVVPSALVEHLHHLAESQIAAASPADRQVIAAAGLTAIVATTDVHEHGKLALENALERLGVAVIDGGISVDADDLAAAVVASGADLVMLSTYNGIALDYCCELVAALDALGKRLPVLVGGRLNQVPDQSNSSLPVDVGDDINATGAVACRSIADALPHLERLARDKT